ncbi:PucR C-terminal helix-turn-helix domain-containing protein [Raineyella antarctica]|uniref:PucR C-terminal helix-turn-helix domain-containing protein n=1 Tax=Raineyella antarctica TaxID=1577474 RepID=A0A1G6HGF3_9ACTN|nr:helix-turn-helix domain-containing protein [Raineyella antarctica]SDB92526.1 PucR C-terminal helix-turn-helix domain-containing protein [Raineyella antarctica]
MRPVMNLDDSLQDLSEALQRRLVVLDERMRVLAYSIHESEEDRERLSHLLAHSDTWRPLPAGIEGPELRDAGAGARWVLVPLRDHRHRVGYLVHFLPAGEDLPPEAVAGLAEGAGRLGVLLSLRTMYAERDAARARDLLAGLLDVRAPADERERTARAMVREGMVGGSEQYCAVVLGVPPAVPDEAAWKARTAVEATLDFVARTSTATVVGAVVEGIGVLVFPRPVVAERLERVLRTPALAEVRAGIGGPVGRLEDVRTSYGQAERAWLAACLDPVTYPRVTGWADLGLDKLLLDLPLDRLTVDDLPDGVRRLLASDHREVDVPTLEAYLDAGGEASSTAAALGIHRSTLYYRLERIRTTTAVDLSDGVARRDLHTGLRVARLAGMLGLAGGQPTSAPGLSPWSTVGS